MLDVFKLLRLAASINESLADMLAVIMLIILGLSVLVGAINCFFGYKLFRIVNALIGGMFGSCIQKINSTP
jgi:type IV secretory pathway VirB2 component (pilin)